MAFTRPHTQLLGSSRPTMSSVLPVLSHFQDLLLVSFEKTRRSLKCECFVVSLVAQVKMTILFDTP